MKRARKRVEGVSSMDEDGDVGPEESTKLGLRVHEWGLNPLFWSHVKLLVRDVHGLGTIDGIDDSHVFHDKAIQRVEVAGIVVHIKFGATKSFGGYVKYIIDDGTGLVPCTQYERWASGGALRHGYAEKHELGNLVVVQGKLKRFRGSSSGMLQLTLEAYKMPCMRGRGREVVVSSTRSPTNPNEEILHWLRCMELAKNVYKPPFRRSEYVNDALVVSSSQARPSRCDCGAAYAEPVGYCRCIAATLALDPTFEFRDALLTRLAAMEESLPPGEHLHLQFARDVRDDPSLSKTAAHVVSTVRSGESLRSGGGSERKGRMDQVFDAKVMELLRAVMSSLYRDGALHFSDKTEDVYVLVSRGRVLQPGIEAVCRDRGLRLTQENEIVRSLQRSALFHHVPGSRIRACLHHMKRSSQSTDP